MSDRSRILLLAVLLMGVMRLAVIAQPVQNGYAAVTCYSDGNPSGIVAALVDVRLAHLQPFNTHWPAPKYMGPGNSWTRSNLGEVFGIAFDATGNVYVTATGVYTGAVPGGPGGSGAVYKLDGVTGAITNFVTTLNAACGSVVGTSTIPNTGNGLGNIAYDQANNQFFVTNFEDGKIYRISSAGLILSVFDPFSPDGCTAGVAPLGERTWGIGVYKGRVYFSRWNEDCGNPSASSANEIWSVGLNGSGDFTGTEQLEITVPVLPSAIHSNPVADIAFSGGGRMLLAERTMRGAGANPLYPNAHASRVLEYSVVASVWTSTGSTFDVGVPASSGCGSFPGGNNAAGGVDYAYGSYDPQTGELKDCDSTIWASGDALKFSGQVVYGFQRFPAGGGNPANSVLIDADGNLGQGDKTQIGDIEVYKHCGAAPTDPCKGIRVTAKQTDAAGEGCCFELTITGAPANTFSTISAQLLTPNVSFSGVIGPSGWNVTNTGTFATWDSSGIVPGGVMNGLVFCLYSLVPAPQTVEISFHAADGTICKDTVTFDCPQQPPPFPPCMTFNRTEVNCRETGPNGSVYDLSFTVTNHSLFSLPPYNLPAENLIVYPVTPGINVTPGSVALFPVLGHNQTSGPLNFTVSGAAAKPGDTVCIVVQIHGKKLTQDYQWCCPPDTLCIVLPPCKDCCDSVDITVKGGVKQRGNNNAVVQSTVNVTPGPVMKAQVSVMSVTRSTVWCPKFSPGQGLVYVPTIAGGPVLAQIVNGTITPTMPLSSGFTPATSEVVWGTVPAGVTMGGNINLNLSFPGSSLGWRCRDTLTICVRYTFTDTACRTCDTVVYYRLARTGEIEIIDHTEKGDVIVSRTAAENPLYEETGTSGHNPLYGELNQGPGIALEMSNFANGVLSLSHWWQDDLPGDPTIRLTEMLVEPDPGVAIRSLTAKSGGQGTIADRVATIGLDLNPRETDLFDIVLNNPNQVEVFTLRVRYRYVELSDVKDTLLSREYIVHGRTPGTSGGDVLGNDNVSERLKGVRTFMLYFANANVLKTPVQSVEITVNEDGVNAPAIIAVGPPNEADPRTVTLDAMQDKSGKNRHETAKNSVGNIRAPLAPGDTILPIYLTVAGIGDKPLKLAYTTYDAEGNVVSRGEIEVNDPLETTAVTGDDSRGTTGSSISIFPVAPNPGQGDRTIRFRLGKSEPNVTIGIYDLSGKEVVRLVDGRGFPTGTHTLICPAADLPNGSYYVVLKTVGEQVSTVLQVVR